LLATIQPDVVVVGGGVGAHFEKFQPFLEEALKKINNPLVPVPPLLKAQRPEEAVIYGCYEYIVQNR
jgi:predicted NBD/HSP70 family sugar kinase